MRNDPTVVDLVGRARDGHREAWHELVERYAPLVWSMCRRYRLVSADAEDVGQSVWLRLVEHLPDLREPAALPGWIATTTQRECLRLTRDAQRSEPVDLLADGRDRADDDAVAVEEEVLLHERHAAARSAFAQLAPRCRQLLTMLVQDPPVGYHEISSSLRMPVGSIGPTRTRCLDKLRRCPALARLIESEQTEAGDA